MIVRNFLFHRVSEEKDALWPPMTPLLFERIIRTLVKTYKVVCLEEWLTGTTPTTEKKIATVLFDDGYKDNISFAAPILKKYNCPASIYIVTDCINNNIPTWTYLLDHALQQTKRTALKISVEEVPPELSDVQLANKDSVRKIKPWMKKLPNAARVRVLNSILDQCADVPLPQNKMMNWDDINELLNGGFHVGSHSHTHPMLAALEDEQEIKDELSISFQNIQQKTGKTPVTISYPIGSLDERVMRLSRQAGYKYGLAVEQKFYNDQKDDIMAIPRVELYQEPWWKVMMRVSGVYQKAKQLW